MWKKVRRPQEEKSRYIKRLKKCWIYKENQDMKKLVSTDFSVENWLILGKKWSMMIATADKYGCRTLPMRNWHLLVTGVTRTRAFFVGHYLWGIDTIHSSTVYSDVNEASSRTLPMRNWHRFARALMAPKTLVLSSDITYEELTRKPFWKPSCSLR